VFHKGDTLPAGDTTLRRQWVEPSKGHVFVIQVFTLAFELNAAWFACLGCISSLGFDALLAAVVLKRVETIFENGRPWQLTTIRQKAVLRESELERLQVI
jgi:hypothetical protein